MKALRAVLDAWHSDRPAGHWVTMTTTISGVPLIAVVYAWSQKGVSFFISTCGSTEVSPVKYESRFETASGAMSFKLINRPELAHFHYEFLPLIDEHNKQRQNLLALEKSGLDQGNTFVSSVMKLGQDVDASQGFVAGMEEQPSHLLNSRSSREGQLAIRMCGIVSVAEDTSKKRGCKSTIRRPSGVARATTCPCVERIDAMTKNLVPREVEHFPASTHNFADNSSVICCGKMHGQKEKFPREERISLHLRRSSIK
ncbi:hypothetical protein IV203_026547 [Nitzschia inconspicua]|uniref:Uncharacterized protein n=1 Tax=Nitzschia inconspicua TaxID=303405 RepID=A0A9K3LJI6_9STRA|nr:hypothetical protein IV203_026547 [Nitzschia inconspicua]